ncbi:conserved hypothetical protein [Xanthomonas citri pv. aurantifolii str. ICPB 11122]|nr:conserved hypothetical protein [Xanthomonas citri pv. aurantifolii str. ICPB 11122]
MHRLKRLAQLAAGFQGAKDRRSKILTVDSLQIGSFLTAASRVLTWELQGANLCASGRIEVSQWCSDFLTFCRRWRVATPATGHWIAMQGPVLHRALGNDLPRAR